MIHPKALKKNAVIGIIAPSSPQRDPSRLDRGIAYLEGLGYRIVLGQNVNSLHGNYLAGTDAERVSDIHTMFLNPEIDAIFCSRGGYGTPRILDKIDYSIIAANPKIFVGFSDTTALQLAILAHSRLVTFSGPMPSVDMADGMHPNTEQWFWDALTSTKPLTVVQDQPIEWLRPGKATGRIIAGNLAVMCSTMGTPYMPPLQDAIVMVEDTGEETYRLDRLLSQLRLHTLCKVGQGIGQGANQPAALLFGQFTQSTPNSNTPHRDVREVLTENLSITLGPIANNLTYGHQAEKLTIPIGVNVSVDSKVNGIAFLEAGARGEAR